MEIIWDRIGKDGWGQATADVDLPMQQHWTYGDVLARLGRQVRRGEIVRGGQRVGLVQMNSRRVGPVTLSLVGRGPVWLEDLPPEERIAACRRIACGAGLVIMTPEQGLFGRGLIPFMTHRHHAVLDLRSGLDTFRNRFAGKWRNRLVRAEAVGLSVCQGGPTPSELEGLLARDAVQQRARGYRALPARFTLAWTQADSGGLRLYRAVYRGWTVATMLMLLHPPTATYHIGWSGKEGRRLNAHQLLLWHAIRDLKGDGYRALDLGDVNTEDAPGLARFKIGSGAEVAPLGATMLVLPAPTRPRS